MERAVSAQAFGARTCSQDHFVQFFHFMRTPKRSFGALSRSPQPVRATHGVSDLSISGQGHTLHLLSSASCRYLPHPQAFQLKSEVTLYCQVTP